MFANDHLGVPLGVAVGSVDEIAAALDVAIENRLRLLRLGAPAPFLSEGHGAEAERTDAKAGPAEGDVVIERHVLLCNRFIGSRITNAVEGAEAFASSRRLRS